jgi:simple sugar transport system ATP-binding protein
MKPDPVPAVEFVKVSKRFGAVAANDELNLHIEGGGIHAIVGENGAGKSTAMKMLYGVYQPDSGEIRLDRVPRNWRSPADAIAAGIGMVHQHFMLAGPCTALENIVVGAEPTRCGFLRLEDALQRVRALAEQYGMPVDWPAPVETLPVGIQQRVEILKLLYRNARILILDEPTAVLTPQEAERLFENLGLLRAEGKTIILVTHKLKEALAVADRVTVMRAGRVIGERESSETDVAQLAELMLGRKVRLAVSAQPAEPGGPVSLEVRALNLERKQGRGAQLSDISFSVKRGEIVGVAGVEGNGQTELVAALLRPAELRGRLSGGIWMLGREVSNWDAGRIRALGVAVIPGDRGAEGLLPEQSLEENFLVGHEGLPSFSHLGFLRRRNIRDAAARAFEEHKVWPRDPTLAAGRLSGGNQQKLIVARELDRPPGLLFACQPTRGVDVGAVESIRARIIKARDDGAGVLLVSSDLDEVLALSDRILVMFAGRIAGEFPGHRVSEIEIGVAMGGG